MRKSRKQGRSPVRRLSAVAAWITAIAALFTAAACGGGQSNPAQDARTITTTPPAVTVTESQPSVPGELESPSSASQDRYLSELEPLTSSAGVDTNSAEINGRGFAQTVTLTANAAGPVSFAEYNLGRKWRTFSATVGLRDDSPTSGSLNFEVSVDGRQTYKKEILLGESRSINIGVENALRLKLTITYTGQDSGNSYYGSWGDAKLRL
ncbi:NPCBM/NEW2 domain-containing protein [Streptomyces sp. NPDC087903]|uniref:NPCBM/NEW2 domain-containing protein n=1 Tax=Streptomyces sp. NPDC087903 TaxID=3365819 RepID=UPI00382738AE